MLRHMGRLLDLMVRFQVLSITKMLDGNRSSA